CFFFFQAEDGIRDRNVTGVQTCALPIFDDFLARTPCDVLLLDLQMERSAVDAVQTAARRAHVVIVTANEYSDEPLAAMRAGARRSEERRVGKECRAGWGAGRWKKRSVR